MRKLAIAMALSTTVLAGPALARDGAWYIGGDFGAMIVEDVDVDFTTGTGDGTTQLNFNQGFDGAAFIGYDLGGFRLEAEVAYKQADLDDYSSSVALPGGRLAGGPFAAGDGDVTALSFMINGMLDFGDDDGLSGFVGGGAGIARVDYGSVSAFSNSSPFLDDSDTRFAWQVVAGVRQAVSRNVDVHLRYRFFNVEDVNVLFTPLAGGAVESTSRLRTHSLLGGISFNFGQAEPPEETQTCWDGSVIPASATCPPQVQNETCPDGVTVVPAGQSASCPVLCPDGRTWVPAASTDQCPVAMPDPLLVFFAWDQDDWDRSRTQEDRDLRERAMATLQEAASTYQRTGRVSLTITGHTDTSGSPTYNQGLSERRAATVRGVLEGMGVPASAFGGVSGRGESELRVETADGVREVQNRRVEIRFGPGSGW